jgi:Mn-dependent DtxR family transcriptional regulator
MSECSCVPVTEDRIKCIVALGCVEGGVATAEKLENMINVPIDRVLDALDGLLRADVVGDVEAEEFYLTEKGTEILQSFYDAMSEVVGERE